MWRVKVVCNITNSHGSSTDKAYTKLKVLLASEFGGGTGHLVHLREIAKQIERKLDAVSFLFCFHDQHRATQVGIPPRQFKAVKPFVTSKSLPTRMSTGNFGLNVCASLFEEEGRLEDKIREWQSIINEEKPDIIIADFALTLNMAAFGRVPLIVIGNGYTLPPIETQYFQNFRHFSDKPVITQDEYLERINVVLRGTGCLPLRYLPELNRANRHALLTIPFFDPYWETRKQSYLGVEIPHGYPHPGPPHGAAIAYISQDYNHPEATAALSEIGMPCHAYFGLGREHYKKQFAGSSVQVVDKPFVLSHAMPGCSVAIHNGSMGFAAAALFAGVPQVSICFHDEHWCNARATQMSQTGVLLNSREAKRDDVISAAKSIAANPDAKKYADELVKIYEPFRRARPMESVAAMAIDMARR